MTRPLTVHVKKNFDGSAVLRCERADGSATWQKQEATYGAFFPRHDLTHYAVETLLGVRRGFYGLLAEGWDITDFAAPWTRGKPGAEAELVELIVGYMDAERATGTRWSAEEYSRQMAQYCESRGLEPRLTPDEEELARIRALLHDLLGRWDALPRGETLVLEFGRSRG